MTSAIVMHATGGGPMFFNGNPSRLPGCRRMRCFCGTLPSA